MTEPNTSSSPGEPGRRTEFIAFYEATYPVVTGELLALTGTSTSRTPRRRVLRPHVAGVAALRTWIGRSCGSGRTPSAGSPGLRGAPAARARPAALPSGALDPEDEVLVAGLQRLPAEHRLPLVLHYLAQCRSTPIIEWFGGTADQLEVGLDAGFRRAGRDPRLARRRGRAGTDDAVEGDAYDWTAEALEDSAQRFGECMPVPTVALVFRRATVKKVTRRGAPITAAAAAAAVGLVVYLSPAPPPSAAAAAFTGPPPSATQAPEPVDAPPAARPPRRRPRRPPPSRSCGR